MSGRIGFFTRSEAKADAYKKGKGKPSSLPTEVLHRLGVRAVEGMNPKAKHPNLSPIGSQKPDLYIIGEFPNATEDRIGEPFVGREGDEIGEMVRPLVEYEETKARYSHIVRTTTPGYRKPKPHEVEAFRPDLVADIERTKPKAILALGWGPLQWCLPHLPTGGKYPSIVARGRRFPAKIGSHYCWVYSVLHPSFLLSLEGKRFEKVPAKEWVSVFKQDVERACKESKRLSPPIISDFSKVEDRVVTITTEDGISAFEKFVETFKGKRLAIDYETTAIRPYGTNARVLSVSVGNGEKALSIVIDHPDSRWSKKTRSRVLRALRRALEGASSVLGQNTIFEAEWTLFLFGDERLVRRIVWDDTMVQGYVLDYRPGGLSLDYLSEQNLGVPVKSLTNVDRKKLDEAPIEDLLIYNGLDVIYTDRLFEAQKPEVEKNKLDRVYAFHRTRIATLVIAQSRGLPVCEKERRKLKELFDPELKETERRLLGTKGVKAFVSKHGSYSPGSSKDNVILFRDILDRDEGRRGKDGYSTDDTALSAMPGKEPALLLQYRALSKLISTYIDRFDPTRPDSYVYRDGKIHCSFKHTFTKSARLSSEDPNNQNWPKRDKKKKIVRRQVKAPEGKKIVSVDFGQIEARVIGMASKDKSFCQALWDNYDVHREWAERIAKEHPPILDYLGHGDLGTLRSEVKNKLVFPAFFLSSEESIGKSLDLPPRILKKVFRSFWKTFSGVKKWQEELLDFYRKNGYVESLCGRRFYGPLSQNMAVNLPIQSTASDIVIDAMDRLSILADEESRESLQPLINIHDDLMFLVEDEKLEDDLGSIIETMVDVPFSFVNVPITVEVETGIYWDQMDSLGKFSSTEL